MKRFLAFFAFLFLATGACQLSAGDYDDAIKIIPRLKPGAQRVGVFCTTEKKGATGEDAAGGQVLEFMMSDYQKAGVSVAITPIEQSNRDIRSFVSSNFSSGRFDAILLIEDDRMIRPGSITAGGIISIANGRKIPIIAINPEWLKYGALAAIGPKTRGKLQVNADVAKRLGLTETLAEIQKEMEPPAPSQERREAVSQATALAAQ